MQNDPPILVSRRPQLACALAVWLAGCTSVRTYGGPPRPETEVARAHFVQPLIALEETDRLGSIHSVDGEYARDRQNAAAKLLSTGQDLGSVELLPGEHTIRVRLKYGITVDVRDVRWEAEPGVSYSLRSRASERQPPVELFVVRDDTGEELAKSWIGPPSIDAFGLDATTWREADWRIEKAWHWITFTPQSVSPETARERLRFEWSEPDRWNPAPRAAWAVGVDLRRELERNHGGFEWQDLESSDARSVQVWSGVRQGRAETLRGLVVVRLDDARVTIGRWTTDDLDTFESQRVVWSEFLGSDAWTNAWTEARP